MFCETVGGVVVPDDKVFSTGSAPESGCVQLVDSGNCVRTVFLIAVLSDGGCWCCCGAWVRLVCALVVIALTVSPAGGKLNRPLLAGASILKLLPEILSRSMALLRATSIHATYSLSSKTGLFSSSWGDICGVAMRLK